MRPLVISAILALFARSVSAHSIFQEVYVNGVDQGHLVGLRVPSFNGPVTDVLTNDIICNGGVNPIATVSPVIITAPAGATITTEWHHGLDTKGQTSDPDEPIAASHHGPVITYLAKVNNATQTDVTGLKWFKIYQDGLNAADQSWGVDRMIKNAGKVTFQLPSCIPAGQYLMRHEIIALHGAGTYPGAQFYMECAQLQITGGGTANPATVSFPGAYQGTDPGITINIYQTLSSYTVPGPAIFSCSGSGTTSAPTTTTTATTTQTSTTTTATQTGTLVPQYGQCGGVGWTGGTVCVSPYVCKVLNAYFSQCLAA